MKSAIITVMSDAAIKAGKGLLRDFGEVDQLQISRKGTSNFVTQSDIRTEKKLVTDLKKARPEYGFLLEEGGEVAGKKDEFRWIIDPLDGTSNFIHAIPYFCISIGLERKIKPGLTELAAGVIYDPIHNELFTAEKGKGAFVNGRRIGCSQRDTFEDAMIVTGNPCHSAEKNASFQLLKNASASLGSIRYTGATALDLAYIAAGRFDAGWFAAMKPWDVAAGILLVQEAGGLVLGDGGAPATPYSTSLMASNKPLQSKMLKLLAD